MAVGMVAETMGELVEFWGFKGSMGKIWATLYLTQAPLSADSIANRTKLSTGAVSMALAELSQWGLVDRVNQPGQRKRHYRAHTDVWEVIRRIFRERELRLVGRSIAQFSSALALLEEARRDDPDNEETRYAITRVKGLLKLAKTGYTLVEKLAEFGSVTLAPIRGTLSRNRSQN